MRSEIQQLIRTFWTGALLGLGLTIGDLLLAGSPLSLSPSEHDGLFAAVFACLTVPGFYGAAGAVSFWASGAMVSARQRDRMRALAAASTFALLTALHLVSVCLEHVAGSFLSWGALQFCAFSPAACTSELSGAHIWTTLFVLFSSGAAGTLAYRWLSRAKGLVVRWPRRFTSPLYLGTLSFSMTGFVAVPLMALHPALADGNAELALISSFIEQSREEADIQEAETQSPQHPKSVRLGPPQTTHETWLAAAAVPPEPPNILLVMLESVPARKLGFEGNDRPVTPNIDKLARNAVRFRRTWTTATHSNYAQMAILSSLFPRRRAGLDTYTRLDYPRFLFHDVFDVLGYRTATISSQDERWQGMRRFQRTATKTDYFHAPDHVGEKFGHGHGQVISDRVTQVRASKWIWEHSAEPWALYINFQATHFPYYRQPGAERRFEPSDVDAADFSYLKYPETMREAANNRYDNALLWVDSQIGALTRTLEQSGQLDNTLWVITSDHGELFGEHGLVTHGRTLFDAEARVPLLMHWPRALKARDVMQPVSTLDILPSVLSALGVSPHPSFQGRDVLTPAGRFERTGVFMNIQGLRRSEAVVCWPWKAVILRPSRQTQLFNLQTDPGETKDLAKLRPDIKEALGRMLRLHTAVQMNYHQAGAEALKAHYAPRLAECPPLEEAPSSQAITAQSSPQ